MTPEELASIEKQMKEWLANNNVQIGYEVSFPVYNILPDEVKLAYSILIKHGMNIRILLGPSEEKAKE